MSVFGFCCAAAGAWIVLAFGLGRGIGRMIVTADAADDAIPPDEDADWLAAWPADTPISVIERAYYDKEFLAIPEVAADLRWAS